MKGAEGPMVLFGARPVPLQWEPAGAGPRGDAPSCPLPLHPGAGLCFWWTVPGDQSQPGDIMAQGQVAVRRRRVLG